MLKINITSRFKTALKKYRYNNEVLSLLQEVVFTLQKGESLPKKYKDHGLKGNMQDVRECHIKPDILLVYYIDGEFLHLLNIGNHGRVLKM